MTDHGITLSGLLVALAFIPGMIFGCYGLIIAVERLADWLGGEDER